MFHFLYVWINNAKIIRDIRNDWNDFRTRYFDSSIDIFRCLNYIRNNVIRITFFPVGKWSLHVNNDLLRENQNKNV